MSKHVQTLSLLSRWSQWMEYVDHWVMQRCSCGPVGLHQPSPLTRHPMILRVPRVNLCPAQHLDERYSCQMDHDQGLARVKKLKRLPSDSCSMEVDGMVPFGRVYFPFTNSGRHFHETL